MKHCQLLRLVVGVASIVSLMGCWNGGNSNIRLGDVSLGQQLIDLQRARDADAITRAEFEQAKQALLSAHALCEDAEEEGS